MNSAILKKNEGGLRVRNIFKNSKNKPLITVITAVFNSEKYLEESILSMHKQNCENIEQILPHEEFAIKVDCAFKEIGGSRPNIFTPKILRLPFISCWI